MFLSMLAEAARDIVAAAVPDIFMSQQQQQHLTVATTNRLLPKITEVNYKTQKDLQK